MNLHEYVRNHTDRGPCRCGKCIDAPPPGPERTVELGKMLAQHTVNMYFFDVSARNNPNVEEFVALTQAHQGEFADVNPLDGEEHGYMELGGWIGDQGLAMQYMALGQLLGLWQTITPAAILDVNDPAQKPLADQMAGMGMVSILPRPEPVKEATILTPKGDNKAFAFDPKTGESKVMDFNNPDADMLKQMADVLLKRLGNKAVLRMLYLDNNSIVPPQVKEIVQALVDDEITEEEARTRIVTWKGLLNGWPKLKT